MKKFTGFERGMGIGGWLTNYKRFQVLKPEQMNVLTTGDMEHFATYITEWDVKNIKSMGFDHVRLGFDQVVLEKEDGTYREETFNHIDNFISWCEKYGLNVVLNLHKGLGSYCDVETPVSLFEDQGLQDKFIKLWEEMERRYNNKPDVVFELLNEVKDVDPELWNDLAEKTINAIRKQNKTRKIIVGTICWNAPYHVDKLRMFDDENVIYTFHFYAPFEFTHQRGVLQASTCFYNRETPYPGDIEIYRGYGREVYGWKNPYKEYEYMDKRFIRDALKPVVEFVKAHPDKILWCGEFGNIRHAKLVWREKWFSDVIEVFKENDIPYAVWNYLSTPNDGNRFSLVDDENRKILSKRFLKVLLGKKSV